MRLGRSATRTIKTSFILCATFYDIVTSYPNSLFNSSLSEESHKNLLLNTTVEQTYRQLNLLDAWDVYENFKSDKETKDNSNLTQSSTISDSIKAENTSRNSSRVRNNAIIKRQVETTTPLIYNESVANNSVISDQSPFTTPSLMPTVISITNGFVTGKFICNKRLML